MKRIKVLALLVLAASLFLSAFVLPSARETTWPDPTVTTLSGDESYTVSIVSPASLAGAYIGSGGFPLPVGFNEGDRQFGGKALVVKGVSVGTQTACFALPTYNAGWRGAVYQWIGSAWQPLVTSFSDSKEGSTVQACATIFGNGTYAFLMYYDPSLASSRAEATPFVIEGCTMDLDLGGWGADGPDGGTLRLLLSFPDIVDGVEYSWRVTAVTPAGVMGALPISGTYTPSFGFIVTSDMAYTSYPDTIVVEVRDTDYCHAALFTPDFDI